jgi:hypothetical protein
MSNALYFAAFLAMMVGIVHSGLGERYLLIRLFKHECFPKIFKRTEFAAHTIRFAWHITSIAWWGFAAILIQLAQGSVSNRGIAQAIGVTFVATGLVALVGSKAKHLAWPVFLLIGAIAFYAAMTV